MTTATATPIAPTVTEKNPHAITTTITGWAVIAVILGALYGASHDRANAAWSALAVIAALGCYLVNKTRKVAYARRARKAGNA